MSVTISPYYRKYIALGFLLVHTTSFSAPLFVTAPREGSRVYIPMAPALISGRDRENSIRAGIGGQETAGTQNFPASGGARPGGHQEKRKTTRNHADEKVYGISGPSQPEMTSFKPVGADNMVNLFTGDFSYNIPLLDVDGYPVNIFYNAGITVDQEASWIGLGWNLNPGTVSRQMRGLPDDFDGAASGGEDAIVKESYIKPNTTVGLNLGGDVEFVGYGNISTGIGLQYNSYTGFGTELNFGGGYNISKTVKDEKGGSSLFKTGSVGADFTIGSKAGLSFKPTFSQNLFNTDKRKTYGTLSTSVSFNSRAGLGDFQMDLSHSYSIAKLYNNGTFGGSLNGGFSHSFAHTAYTPSIRMPVSYKNFSLNIKMGAEIPIGVLLSASMGGFLSESSISKDDQRVVKPAFGYLNMQNSNGRSDALLDFNRLNDGGFIPEKTPAVALPQYTYDMFNISGEGTGGSFRAYRADIGYVRDPFVKSKTVKGAVGMDWGAGAAAVNIGLTLDGASSKTFVSEWSGSNLAKEVIPFRSAGSPAEEPVYFRNPGEMATSPSGYYNNIDGEKLGRLQLEAEGAGILPSLPTVSGNLITYTNSGDYMPSGTKSLAAAISSRIGEREKRSQSISYLTAKEAAVIGLGKDIHSFNRFNKVAPFPCDGYTAFGRYGQTGSARNYRQPNHISEIDVVEPDGKRYIFGLPVYNEIQKEISFAIDDGQSLGDGQGNPTQVAGYPVGQNTLGNSGGKDEYYSAETIPAYAHSFLITGLLSPDYSDVSGDGITDDDIGTAAKFNYSRVGFDGAKWHNYSWRTPTTGTASQATYNQGLKVDKTDDKAFYSFGKKELWYVHSIESKSMVAVFYTSNRKDGLPVKELPDGSVDENSAVVPNSDVTVRLQALDKIELYSKADLVKSKGNAKPVKTVNFEYDYSLCPNTSNSELGPDGVTRLGKLTLKKLWFTYNGAATAQKNRYNFRYNGSVSGKAAVYDRNAHDPWGTFKPSATGTDIPSANPPGMGNADFQFSAQPGNGSNVAKGDLAAYAGAWSLGSIDIPSGATIDVTYESDDYAYVQDRAAAQMTRLAGFSDSKSGASEKLYTLPTASENSYVFFDVADGVPSGTEADDQKWVNNHYLRDMRQLLMKLYVKVTPVDGYEPVIVYSDIDQAGGLYDAGVDLGTLGRKRIWIKLKSSGNTVVDAVFQYLKDHLPGKVFPGSDVSEDIGPVQVIKSMTAMLTSITDLIGETNKFKLASVGKKIDASRSFGRLSNPSGIKFGGGHRVAKIEISDNWDKLTQRPAGGPAPEVGYKYGQEYDYSTTETLGGMKREISSGVASYEPSGAGEENPFREMFRYNTSQFLGPTSFGAVEMPLAEGFYPSAMVGYSKVTVRSANRDKVVDGKKVKAGAGIQRTEFYTTKDFPTLSDFTPLLKGHNLIHYKPNLLNFFQKFYSVEYTTVSQGFRVQLNNMNGKMKLQTTYPEGKPDEPVQFSRYIYRTLTGDPSKLDNTVRVVQDASGQLSDKTVGKDIELMVDFREHSATTYSAKLRMNLEWQYPFVFIPSAYPGGAFEQTIFRSASVVKIINTYGILERVEAFDKGSNVSTNNLVYDAETGDPLLTSTGNTFNKPVYSYKYPAYWAYDRMGPAYKNINVSFKSLYIRNGFVENGTIDQSLLQAGDELYVEDKYPYGLPENGLCANCGGTIPKNNARRIWAVDLWQDPGYTRTNPGRWLFVDREGNPYNGGDVYMRVVRSGRRNILAASVGAVSSLQDPRQNNAIQFGAANILNTNAVVFKENWKSEDAFYSKLERDVPTTFYAPIHVKNYNVDKVAYYGRSKSPKVLKSFSFKCKWYGCWPLPVFDRLTKDDYGFDRPYVETRSLGPGGDLFPNTATKSWMRFNFSDLTQDNIITSAKMSLYAHRPDGSLPAFGHNPPKGTQSVGITPFVPWTMGSTHDEKFSHIQISGVDYLIKPLMVNNSYWNNAASFVNIFDQPNSAVAGVLSLSYSTRDKSFCGNCQVGTDNRIPLNVSVINDMIARRSSNSSLTTTFELSKGDYTTIAEERACFSSGKVPGEGLAPQLEIKYYVKSESSQTPPVTGEYYSFNGTADVQRCYSYLDGQYFNPYVLGFLGNWRSFKAYSFYDDRKENYAERQKTDVSLLPKAGPRTDGTLNAYEPFWSYSATSGLLLANTASTKWVWNSAISQVNRRGMEVENYDPLGRYNAGIYGYNGGLPLAVVNNSRLAESFADGFEDYDGFSDEFCAVTCKPRRHLEWGGLTLDQTQHHTGKYSLKVPQNSTREVLAPVAAMNNNEPQLYSNVAAASNVSLNGTGLTARYTMNGNTVTKLNVMPAASITSKGWKCKHDPHFNLNVDPGYPFSTAKNVSITWTGGLNVDKTGPYRFMFNGTDDDASVNVMKFPSNTPVVNLASTWNGGNANPNAESPYFNLEAGTTYQITITYFNACGGGKMELRWRKPCGYGYEPIAQKYLYNTPGTVPATTLIMCKPSMLKVKGNLNTTYDRKDILVSQFAPQTNKKMVLSAWVKEVKDPSAPGDDNSCHCSAYTNNQIIVSKVSGGTIITQLASFTPSGPVIDGWQRYEGEFEIAGSAELLKIELKNNTSGVSAFFDDIRIHPFNSNMKAFVYDPVSLRLKAELDENNFASFYEYDDEGTLTRVKKETREGIKTIQETRSALGQK